MRPGGIPRACIVSAIRPALDVRTFHKIARSLAAIGWEVTVIGRDPGPARTVDGIHVRPLPRVHGPARAVLQSLALRHALATRADVYQVADLELLPAALLLRRGGRPVVYDCREDYPAYMRLKTWIPRRCRPAASIAVDRLERIAARRLDGILTADEGTARRLRGHGGRVAVAHNFPRRDDFAPPPSDAPRRFDVVYHGSLPAYNLLALADVAGALARRLGPTRWRILGKPDSVAAESAFTEALAASGVAERVQLRPPVPFERVGEFLRGARTGVVPLPDLPKFRTNVPMKLFEYLAAGVPAVASDLPPTRALVADTDAAVLVPPGDHDGFADALAGLLRDPTLAGEQARRGRAVMEERFNWEREEPALRRLYASVLCGPGVRAIGEEMLA